MGREDLRWYAYLHHFDNDGTYLGSDIEFVGTNVEGQADLTRGLGTFPKLTIGSLPAPSATHQSA